MLCVLLLQACNPPPAITTNQEPAASIEPTLIGSMDAVTKPTAPPQPTLAPTATVWPPAFDFWSLQDIRNLDSFVVTINEKNTVNGQLTELTNTIGYIKEPYSAYHHNEHASGVDRTYVVNGWTYSITSSGDWYISARPDDGLFSKADIPGGNTGKLLEAQFVAPVDFQGIPAYHFVLELVNSTVGNTTYQLEGDFYLAQEGNYVLYSHWKETSSQTNFTQVYEVTTHLSSINQLMEIQLPADMQEMVAAVELPAEMGLPLPGDSAINRMIRYKHGIGVDIYFFTTRNVSVDEFLDFYRALPPTTNGWQVTHIGHVSLHQDDCEFTHECVMISNGSTQVILFNNGTSTRAEFDWLHIYEPVE